MSIVAPIIRETDIEAAGAVLDETIAYAVIHQRQCRTRQRGLDCLACEQHDNAEFAAQSRHDALVLQHAQQRRRLTLVAGGIA